MNKAASCVFGVVRVAISVYDANFSHPYAAERRVVSSVLKTGRAYLRRHLFSMKFISLTILMSAAHFAFAQTPAANMLPDGSTDTYVGLGLLSEPSCEFDGEQRTRVMPNVQMQWSNGVFLRNTNLGLHLSKSNDMEYGPLLAYQRGCSVSAARKLAGYGDINGSFQAGGFFNIFPRADLRLSSKLLFGKAAGKNNAYFNLEGRRYFRLASHHGIALSGGLNWSRRYYDSGNVDFEPGMATMNTVTGSIGVGGVSTHGGDAEKNGKASLKTNANVSNIYLGVNWNWELSPSWLLTSQITAARQLNTGNDSLLLGKRNYLTVYSGVAYRF